MRETAPGATPGLLRLAQHRQKGQQRMVKATAAVSEASSNELDEMAEMDELTARHRDLERQIAALDRHLSLSSAEQIERTRLKKEKLRVKDRLQLLQARTTLTGA
ncbi:MAG TPA: YdcH family protein [Polyangia bacterium]